MEKFCLCLLIMKCKANVEKYLKQARTNEELVLFFDKNCKDKRFYRWAFVALFYSALHYFYALLRNKGEPLPDNHTGKSGGNEKADSLLYTVKNGIQDSAAADYLQLFQWGFDVRYKPERAELLEEKHLEEAKKCLEGVKLVAFNETGFRPKSSKSGKSISIIETKQKFLEEMHSKRKNK